MDEMQNEDAGNQMKVWETKWRWGKPNEGAGNQMKMQVGPQPLELFCRMHQKDRNISKEQAKRLYLN